MKCQKWPYTLVQAERLLKRKFKPGATGLNPVRRYWCAEHKAWHLTSKVKYGRYRNG